MIPSDSDIKHNIEKAILWDSRIKNHQIIVEVENGEVTLTGSVPCSLAKWAAHDNAMLTAGSTTVKNSLRVAIPQGAARITDDMIMEMAQLILYNNVDVCDMGIEVFCDNGVVTLKGSVSYFWQREKAEVLLESLRGVVEVVNLLTVVPTESLNDEFIAEDISSAFQRNKQIPEESIQVQVKNGVVTLSGVIDDYYTTLKARRVAGGTHGVKDVINGIKVVFGPDQAL